MFSIHLCIGSESIHTLIVAGTMALLGKARSRSHIHRVASMSVESDSQVDLKKEKALMLDSKIARHLLLLQEIHQFLPV